MRLSSRVIYFAPAVLCLIIFANCNAQIISERILDRLDSLLVKENFAEINSFFASQEVRNRSSRLSDKGKGDFEILKSSYLSTVKNIVD